MATAGAAGGEIVNVEQVFSTDLWIGTGSPPAINNGIALADSANGNTGSSTKFSGSSQYLSKSSDLTGNANGKTFTVSFWINPTDDTNTTKYIYHTSGSWRNTISYGTNGTIFVSFFQSASGGGTVFEIQNPEIRLGFGGWNHVIFSADMTDTSKRHLYINDQAASATYTHTNNNIDFTRTQHAIGEDLTASTGNLQGYLAHFFLDYTYRDLSVESNRRTFIDSARGSTSVSTLSALNPILYLPMTSGYSIGENEGTGGDFSAVGSPTIDTTNGTEAESGVGQGGMVWYRRRDDFENNTVEDTERGIRKQIYTDATNSTGNATIYGLQAFNSNGFFAGINTSGGKYVSWTFRKAEKFFDIVTWTGDGVNGRSISHSLNSLVGMVTVKCTSNSGTNWSTWHRGAAGTLWLNSSNADSANGGGQATSGFVYNPGSNTSAFTVDNGANVNQSGRTYVAYIWAHNNNDGTFGPDSNADIIKCGSFSGAGATPVDISLGFEAQWVLIKSTNYSDAWYVIDNMRGMFAGTNAQILSPNATTPETASYQVTPTADGFSTKNFGSHDYIYMAIRRGPMAVPTSSTNVFGIETWTGNNTGSRVINTDVTHDTALLADRGTGNYFSKALYNRLTGDEVLATSSGQPDSYWTGTATRLHHDVEKGIELPSNAAQWNSSSDNFIGYFWKCAPNFFDAVAFKRSSVGAVDHSLGVAPKMIWVKGRNVNQDWYVYHEDLGNSAYLRINEGGPATTSTNATWNSVSPTATQFTIGGYLTAYEYSAWLFGSVDGVSKVGSYTGNGSSSGPTIDCGFSNGPRWVLIKRATGGSNDNWAVFDTTRGLSSGNDHYFSLENNDSEFSNVDWIDPTNAGFQVVNSNSSVNASSSTYIFYAIAAS